MYADLNTSEKLTVERSKKPGFRFLYKIVNNETGATILTRYSNRKFVAATISGNFFGSLDRAAAHGLKMKEGGVPIHMVETFYCYLVDATAFEPAPAYALNTSN